MSDTVAIRQVQSQLSNKTGFGEKINRIKLHYQPKYYFNPFGEELQAFFSPKCIVRVVREND